MDQKSKDSNLENFPTRAFLELLVKIDQTMGPDNGEPPLVMPDHLRSDEEE